jgi:hypothetical protein
MIGNRFWIFAAVLCFSLGFLAGCGGDKDKGSNRNLDRPTLANKN